MEGTPQHVLLVDDSELVTDAMRIMLEAMGRTVSIAGTVADAVGAVDRDRPDVILLDFTLPDGSGLEVARHALAVGSEYRPAIAALTGHDEPSIAAQCATAGCLATFVKPVSTRTIIARLDEWRSKRTDGL